jgi:hypothetical protein
LAFALQLALTFSLKLRLKVSGILVVIMTHDMSPPAEEDAPLTFPIADLLRRRLREIRAAELHIGF